MGIEGTRGGDEGSPRASYPSLTAPIELSLILKNKGLRDKDIARVLNAVDTIVSRYTKARYPNLSLRELIYAAELRTRYPELTFFDSIHAAVAIVNSLAYYDLDPPIKEVVANEYRR